MSNDQKGHPLFNLETMSGVRPGSRTSITQRVRLIHVHQQTEESGRWARIFWYNDPPSWALFVEDEDGNLSQTALHGQQVTQRRSEGSPNSQAIPNLEAFLPSLVHGLAEKGWLLQTCGTCQHWQPLGRDQSGEVSLLSNEDGIPIGGCRWQADQSLSIQVPESLYHQSALALSCQAWQERERDGAEPSNEMEIAVPQYATPQYATAADEEVGDDRQSGFLSGLLGKFRSRPKKPRPSWGEQVAERSGVGAGTEPCFACQGRLANLGALVVATEEDDKRTFSIWRCRRCASFYLNDWFDRWERLDTLETEERYYRLAPAEALSLLALFDGVEGAEHPAGRYDRAAQRQWIESLLENHTPLSVQIRHGR